MKYSKKNKLRKQNNTRKNKCTQLFELEDYNSSDGMITSIWGPPLWHFLHTMSFNYPVNPSSEDKKYYRNPCWNYSSFIINLLFRYFQPPPDHFSNLGNP